MGIRERKARQKESLRQEILNAAREILLKEGSNQLSMRRIAERIEYTPTTIYLYFKDKADILFHLCEEVYGRIVEIMQSAGAGVYDPVECLYATIRSYIEFGLSQPDRYRIAFMTDITPSVDPTNFLKAGTMGVTAYELLGERVKKVAGEDRSSPEEIEATTQTLWALAHGVVSLLITYRDFPWADREILIETAINMAIEKLRNRSGRGC